MSCTKITKWLSAIVFLVAAQSTMITTAGLSSSPEMLLPSPSLSALLSSSPLLEISSQDSTQISTSSSSPLTTTTSSSPSRRSQSSSIFSTLSSSSSSVSSSISTQTTNNPTSTEGPEETDTTQFFRDLKYIYIIVGVIMFLVLIIILLIAVVGIMCQRRMFDRKHKINKTKNSPQLSPLITSVEVQPARTQPHPKPPPAQKQPHPKLSPARKQPYPKSSPVRTPPKSSPARTQPHPKSPTRNTKSTENGPHKNKDVSTISDFPLLCRVLQDYDSTQRQISVTSSDTPYSPARSNGSIANGTPQHQNSLVHAALINELETSIQSNASVSDKQQPSSGVPITPNVGNRARAFSEESSEFEASWGKSTTVSYMSGYRDSNDYDELESIVEQLKNKEESSPPRSLPKVPLKIPGPVFSPPLKPLVPGSNHIKLRRESMKRSQSSDDIFDDPKYTRLSVVSPNCAQPNLTTIQEKADHMPNTSVNNQQGNAFFKQPLAMKRSVSTSATGEILVGGRDYKEYMSLQQLLEIMDTKIPSRETSAETDDREEQLYCPRVLHPVLLDDSS